MGLFLSYLFNGFILFIGIMAVERGKKSNDQNKQSVIVGGWVFQIIGAINLLLTYFNS